MARCDREPWRCFAVVAVPGLIFLGIFFQFGMLTGFLLLFAFWASGGHRSLPVGILSVFVFGLPLASWLIGSLAAPVLILIVPGSFAVAFGWSYRNRRGARLVDRDLRSEKLLGAERQISEDSKNAGAFLARAEILEEDGRYEEARADYQRAFGASDRAVSRFALKDHEDRLDHAVKAREARLEYEKHFFVGFLRAARIEWGIMAAGLVVGSASIPHGLALMSMGLMAAWCRRLTGF